MYTIQVNSELFGNDLKGREVEVGILLELPLQPPIHSEETQGVNSYPLDSTVKGM